MEGEQKLCLVELTLELMEKKPLQVQMQLLEEMQDMEALEAEGVLEGEVEEVIGLILPLAIDQEQMEAEVELVVMEAVAAEAELGGLLLKALQERGVQEVLVVLEEEAAAEEMLGVVQVLMGEEIMVVMVEQEVMAVEEEKEGLLLAVIMREVLVAVALAALD